MEKFLKIQPRNTSLGKQHQTTVFSVTENCESPKTSTENVSSKTEHLIGSYDLGRTEGAPHQPLLSQFPHRQFGKQKRGFNRSWYSTFNWLEYCTQRDAAFCFPCRHFAICQTGKSDIGFTTRGVKDWKHALLKFQDHESSEAHLKATERWPEFKTSSRYGTVAEKITNADIEQINRRRMYLHRVVEVLLLTARQGIAQRGHRENDPSGNQGNVIEFLNTMKKFDSYCDPETSSLPANASYLSPSSQNDILCTSADILRETILSEVKNSGFFSLLADDTRDISKAEQMSLCVRYYHDNKVKERFLSFLKVEDLSANGLTTVLCAKLRKFGLDYVKCVGQGYDGAAVMSGHLSGVQQLFKKEFPQAVYIHCYAHRLNLVLVDACKNISEVRDYFNLLQNLYSFFSFSGKMHESFLRIQKDLEIPATTLKSLSDTRWACQVRSIKALMVTYPALLQLLKQTNDGDVIKAKGLFMYLQNFKTVVLTFIFHKCLSLTETLNAKLQAADIDIDEATAGVQAVIESLQEIRCDESFSIVFEQAQQFSETYEIVSDMNKPTALARKQSREKLSSMKMKNTVIMETTGHRDSYENKNKFKTYVVLDRMINELKRRFSENNSDILKGIHSMSPQVLDKSPEVFLSESALTGFCTHYGIELPAAELIVARNFIMKLGKKPESITDLLNKLPQDLFPNLCKILQIGITIPVTSASCERSFSVLKRIKNYLRSTMQQERISSLGLLSIEREACKDLCVDCIIDTFAEKSNRRVQLVHRLILHKH